MKRTLFFFLALALIISLVACGNNSDKPAINDDVSTETNQKSETGKNANADDDASGGAEANQNSEGKQVSDEDDTDDDFDRGGTSDGVYDDKVYIVGEDIPEGTYTVNCTKSDYGMDVVVFESKSAYKSFLNAERFTVGEYRTAIEQNAWLSLYIKENETAYIGLESGNIILLDSGMCEFSSYDVFTSNLLYSGIYVVGEDIPADNLDIKGTTDYLKIVVFDSIEKYSSYYKSERFTIGEESDAIEANASSSDYIYGDDSTSVRLEDGMVLMIDDGIGEYSKDEGPIIN